MSSIPGAWNPITNSANAGTIPSGSVLGASTTQNPVSSPAPQAPAPAQTQNVVTPQVSNPTQALQNATGGAWDAYTSQLNDMLNTGLPGEQSGMQQTAQGSYQQALDQAAAQQTTSTDQVNQQQAASLKDLGSNVKNLFQSGNVYLGALGAGDSSAANQYAYAIANMGTQSRGNILQQANQRIQQIGDIYNTQKSTLSDQLTQQMGSIATWFNNAQNTLRQQLAQAPVQKQSDINNLSMNLYNQALQAAQNVQNQYQSQQSALQQWAMNNSTSTQQLISNMQAVQQMPAFQGIANPFTGQTATTGGASTVTPVGNAGNTTQQTDIFGNPIQTS